MRKKSTIYDQRKMVSRTEAALTLGVTPQTISNYIDRGIITGTKCGTHTYVFKESLENAFNESRDADAAKKEFEAQKASYDLQKAKFMEMSSQLMEDINLMRKTWGMRHEFVEAICGICGASDTEKNPDFTRRTADIIMSWVEGNDYSYIAEANGMTCERVRQLIRQGLHRLPKWKNYVEIIRENHKLKTRNAQLEYEHDMLASENDDLRQRLNLNTSDIDVNPLLTKSILDVGLSRRATNCLRSASIGTVYDLTRMTPEKVLSMNQMGKKTLQEINEFLENNGLSLNKT